MTTLNVSFGIFAFMPAGWIFMLLVILGEAFIMSRYLLHKAYNARVYCSAAMANIVSGIIGIIVSLWLNGGWWLVVWFPWVSRNEVNVGQPLQVLALIAYYVVALILSVLIEAGVNHLFLRSRYDAQSVFRATLRANAFSYALGAVILIILLFII